MSFSHLFKEVLTLIFKEKKHFQNEYPDNGQFQHVIIQVRQILGQLLNSTSIMLHMVAINSIHPNIQSVLWSSCSNFFWISFFFRCLEMGIMEIYYFISIKFFRLLSLCICTIFKFFWSIIDVGRRKQLH